MEPFWSLVRSQSRFAIIAARPGEVRVLPAAVQPERAAARSDSGPAQEDESTWSHSRPASRLRTTGPGLSRRGPRGFPGRHLDLGHFRSHREPEQGHRQGGTCKYPRLPREPRP